MLAAILAHQGGWDEMLMVAGPIGIFAYILHRANQRAEKAAAEAGGDLSDDDLSDDDALFGGAALLEGDDIRPE